MYCDYFVAPDTFPLPYIQIQATDKGVSGLYFHAQKTAAIQTNTVIKQCQSELEAYFSGHQHLFTVPLDLVGTPFQQRVWQALLTIPFGKTCSYHHIAQFIAAPNAQRAVGAANGRNPVSLIVPCHRVIGSNGKLVGYGGGLPIKQWLLDHEKNVL